MELFSKVLLQQQQPPHLILCSHVSWRSSQRTTAAFTFLRHVQQQCSEKLAFSKSSYPLLYAHESSKNRERKEEEEEEQKKKKKKKRKKWRRRGSASQVVAESLFGHGAISGQEEVESRGEGTWTTYDSSSLYRLQGWGAPYFVINSQGHLCVRPSGSAEGTDEVDLVAVIETLAANHIHLPLVLRFPDILHHRMLELQTCFSLAASKFNYKVLLISRLLLLPLQT
jgi:hypothetical protein